MGKVSIIIPTHNRGEILKQTLPSYINDPLVAEVIIVDDGSADDTLEICNEMALQDNRIKVFHQENLGAPAARNTGIRKVSAETDYIFFGEDDAFLEDNAITRLVECLVRTKSDIAGGLIVPIGSLHAELKRPPRSDAGSIPVNLNLLRANFKMDIGKEVEVPFIHALFLAKKAVFEEVKFDERYFGNAYREETDFCIEAAKRGARIYFCPQSALFHIEAKQGGQRRITKLSYEVAVLQNNWYFLNKHYTFLKARYNIVTPKLGLQSLLILRRLYLLVKNLVG